MFRLCGKIIKNNRIICDQVFEVNSSDLSLQDKINKGLESLCYHFDIQTPLWFNDHDKDFARIGKTRFTDHHFVEDLDFDYLEIEIIENQ